MNDTPAQIEDDENAPGPTARATLSFPKREPRVDLSALAVEDPPVVHQEEMITQTDHPLEMVEPIFFNVRSPITDENQTPATPLHFTVELPSKGYFYGTNGVVIPSLVRGKHQVKFTRAAQAGSYRYMVEAVGSTLQGCDVMALTQQDMVMVMYWLRLNSYKKSQYTHVTYCNDAAHRAKVAAGELEEATLKTLDIVSNTNLEIDNLNIQVMEAFLSTMKSSYAEEFRELNGAGVVLSAPLVGDVVSLSEMIEDAPYAGDEDAQELLDIAVYLTSLDDRIQLSLPERSEIAGSLSPEAGAVLRSWQAIVTNYGVTESRQVTCQECGVARRVPIVLTPADFF